jgi:hypothetical protein
MKRKLAFVALVVGCASASRWVPEPVALPTGQAADGLRFSVAGSVAQAPARIRLSATVRELRVAEEHPDYLVLDTPTYVRCGDDYIIDVCRVAFFVAFKQTKDSVRFSLNAIETTVRGVPKVDAEGYTDRTKEKAVRIATVSSPGSNSWKLLEKLATTLAGK